MVSWPPRLYNRNSYTCKWAPGSHNQLVYAGDGSWQQISCNESGCLSATSIFSLSLGAGGGSPSTGVYGGGSYGGGPRSEAGSPVSEYGGGVMIREANSVEEGSTRRLILSDTLPLLSSLLAMWWARQRRSRSNRRLAREPCVRESIPRRRAPWAAAAADMRCKASRCRWIRHTVMTSMATTHTRPTMPATAL